MSALVIDVRPIGHGGDSVGMFDPVEGQGHPRGQGFRVLSRMARTQASDSADYAPRHRRDVAADLDARTSIAS